jgi:hypothetical protein
MGQSATAYLCFGLTLQRDAIEYDEDAPKGSPSSLWVNGATKGDPVCIVETCVNGNPIHLVAIPGTVLAAPWYEPADLTAHIGKILALGSSSPDWAEVLTRYVEQWGLTDQIERKVHPDGTPRWLLAAHFG